MKQRIQTIRRAISALLALLSLAFAAGCSVFDPVVSVGSPSPALTQSAVPEDTAAPATPEPYVSRGGADLRELAQTMQATVPHLATIRR